MPTTRDLAERCERVLSAELEPGESAIARGRADHAPSLARVPMGSGYTFLIVTADRVLWTHFLGPRRVDSLRFRDVLSGAQGTFQHRFVLLLRHRPVLRPSRVPPHRFLWFRWGDPSALRPHTEAILEFSREDTVAARVIGERLAAFAVPLGVLVRPRPRRQPEAKRLLVRTNDKSYMSRRRRGPLGRRYTRS